MSNNKNVQLVVSFCVNFPGIGGTQTHTLKIKLSRKNEFLKNGMKKKCSMSKCFYNKISPKMYVVDNLEINLNGFCLCKIRVRQ